MYLVFDTETTGQALDYDAPVNYAGNWPRLVELAWALFDADGQPLQQHHYLVRPAGYDIPAGATRIHGIGTAQAAAKGRPLAEVLGLFAETLALSRFSVAHNAAFDCQVLRAELHRLGQPDFMLRVPVLCTMQMGAAGHGAKWPKLAALHTRLFGTGFEGGHRAGADVAACARCFFELLEQGHQPAGVRVADAGTGLQAAVFQLPPKTGPGSAMPLADTALARPVRAAVAHLFATGAHHLNGKHGLLHVGLLPLVAGAAVQEWVVRKPRKSVDMPAAVRKCCELTNEAANAAPSWETLRADVQAAFAGFDAILILDRAGGPSPERAWFEREVLPGGGRPGGGGPVCVALEQLTAFFLPTEAFDDADDLTDALLLAGTDDAGRLRAECGHAKDLPQLPFVLHAMRRAVRRTLASLLQTEPTDDGPAGAGQWAPAYALLRQVLETPGKPAPMRGFRLLAELARQPTCCDGPPPADLGFAPLPPLPQLAALEQPAYVDARRAERLLVRWLMPVGPLDPAEPPIRPAARAPDAPRVEPAEVMAGFEEVKARETARHHEWQPRPAQEQYARFVTDALNRDGAYAVEAGTGTGKTYGYLVPALEYLRQRPNGLVVVATSTKNLQDQMMQGELPALCNRLDGSRNARYGAVRAVLFKGKNCYLCADALAAAFGPSFAPVAGWPGALAWLYLALRLRDAGGDIENVALSVETLFGPSGALRQLRALVAATEACNHGDKGPRQPLATCVYARHRLRAEQANLLVVNHHKLAVLSPKILKDRECLCIVDEADRFADNFRSARKRELDGRQFYQKTLLPLLGKADDAHHALLDAGSQAAAAKADGAGFVGKLQDRLETVWLNCWLDAGFDRFGSATSEADVQRLEKDIDDQLAALAPADAADPETADPESAEGEQHEAYRKLRDAATKRRAAWQALTALRRWRPVLRALAAELLALGQHFVPAGGRPARLPFPKGEETHWLSQVEFVAEGGKTKKSFAWQLHDALLPLEWPLTAANEIVALVAGLLPALLDLPAPNANAAGTEPTPDEKLLAQTLRYASQLNEAAFVVRDLTRNFRHAPQVPVLRRASDTALGWALVRLPFDLRYLLWETAPNGAEEEPLFGAFKVVVFTSATLYVADSSGTADETAYFRRQLCLAPPFARHARIAAAFDFKQGEKVVALTLAYPPRFAHPNYLEFNEPAWREAQARALLPLLVAPEGRTLVLFTKRTEMDAVFARLQPRLGEYDIEALKQADYGTSQWEIRRFRRVQQSVLFGLERMWTGVDFPGKTLVQVVVWRLPLPNFADVLVFHRKQHENKVFWNEFYYPTARLKMRQGFGRLVRRSGDQGAFVVLDVRADPTVEQSSAHVLAELHDALDFQSCASAEELHQRVVNEMLVLPGIGLKTNFETGRNLSAEKLDNLWS